MTGLKIGALADRTGTNAPTIRFYEEIGLLRSPDRQAGGQRIYGDEDVRRLRFIRRCREFGFPIEVVRSLVVVLHNPHSSCMEARDLAQQHLVGVRQKIADLETLERNLTTFVADCDAGCAGGPGPDCVILDDLSKGCCGASVRGGSPSKAARIRRQ
jgi:DNA-binding transcriptional MerR regulator